MTLPTLSSEDQQKLKTYMREGIKVRQEMADLSEGLSDVSKHLGDELDISVRTLKKALTMAFREQEKPNVLQEEQDDLDAVNEILELTR